MTKILPVRLNEKESAMLDEILSSENCESENRSEWIRLLIWREWNKRKKLGVPKSQDFSTSFRYLQTRDRNRITAKIPSSRHNATQFKLPILISRQNPDSSGARASVGGERQRQARAKLATYDGDQCNAVLKGQKLASPATTISQSRPRRMGADKHSGKTKR